jgi:prevent-host-death family protein
MQAMPISKATRGALGEAVSRARWRGERTTISVRGKPAAVLVSVEDAAQLEERRPAALEPAG